MTHKLLRFGAFELNLSTEELRKHGTIMRLSPQPFQLLALLASHSGQIVSREEIHKRLWDDDTFVDFEQGVNKCIKQVRAVLSDNADRPFYIETIPRQGYRFLADVVSKTVEPPAPRVTASTSGIQSRTAVAARLQPDTAQPGAVQSVQRTAVLDVLPLANPENVESRRKPSAIRFWWAWLTIAVLGIGLIAGVFYWRSRQGRLLTEKDTIILADFVNTTGDSVFDDTLKQGLAINLGQSPFLALVSERKVTNTLKLMSRQADERLTPEEAREVCQRTGSKAMVAGSIAGLGNQYVIGLKVVDCNTGDVLAETQKQAAGKESVLKALDAAATSTRSKLGESLSSVQKYATPLQEATTPSLEALKVFSLGQRTRYEKGETAGLPFFRRAVEIDPNFAMAYLSMSISYANLSEVGRAAENANKAYTLRQKVSERERFDIEANYYIAATGELEKAAQVYASWQQVYPRDAQPYTAMGFTAGSLGNWEQSLEADRNAMRLEPNTEINYANLGNAYANLNRLDEADAVYRQAAARKRESEGLLGYRYQLAFLRGDATQMAALSASAKGKPGWEDWLLALQADTEAWHGRFKNARDLTRQAMESALHNDAKEAAAVYQAEESLREVEAGNMERAHASALAAVNVAPNRDVRSMAALSLARAGDTAAAETLAQDLDHSFPLDTLVQRYWLPSIGAAIALQRKDPNHAIELLNEASTIELAQTTNLAVPICPAYLRAEAYLMLHDGQAAKAEFQKFVDHWGLVSNFPWGALARLGIARACALSGDKAKSKAAYQDFFALWKDADPDTPILIQAKAEFAQLQ